MARRSKDSSLGSYVGVFIVALLIGRCSVSNAPETAEPAVARSEASVAQSFADPTAAATVNLEATSDEPELLPASKPSIAKPDEYDAADRSPVYYRNCSAARAAGAAPVHEGEPGYASHLDRDNDGVGCE